MINKLRSLFAGESSRQAPVAIDLEGAAMAAKELGNACLAESKLSEARAHYLRALALNPAFAEVHNNLGHVLGEQGAVEASMVHFRRAMELKPELANPYFNLAKALQLRGEAVEAIAYYRHALDRAPDFAEAHFRLGLLLTEQGRLDESVAHLRTSTKLAPENPAGHASLGMTLSRQGKFHEAHEALLQATRADPENAAAHSSLGNNLLQQGLASEAQAHFERALAIGPESPSPQAEFNLALALLLQGEFKRGWRYFESRWEANNHDRPAFSRPLWRGENLAGKKIFVHFEYGLGDTLQFVRYLPLLAQRGAQVIFGCQRELATLLASVDGTTRIEGMNSLAEIVAFGNAPADFDYHVPLLSLPYVLDTTAESIPGDVPYVQADREKVAYWQTTLAPVKKLKVGLVWRGNQANVSDASRSIPLDMFAPLFELQGVQFHSLQMSAKEALSDYGIVDYTAQFRDFSDTAAFCQALDLIISVDTSVAHLAGALAKPVWLLNRFKSEWRWMLDRDDSLWYPTMRIYRQTSLGDWPTVIGRVAQELERLVADRGALRS